MVARALRGYLVLSGFFLLGALAGIAVGRAYTQREMIDADLDPQTREAISIHAIAAELDLNEQERRHLASVAAKYRSMRREATQEMYDSCGQGMRALQVQMSSEVTAGFRPEKAASYLEVIAARRKQQGMSPRQ